jgi:DNA-binding GntR family transcriptional regulator
MRTDNFFSKYKRRDLAHAPKHMILREAMIAGIQDGHWKCGDRLPTESELTELTPYSLGTVQRAVQALVAEGFVTRKQGRGTFVTPLERRVGSPWLFRFLTADESDFASMSTRVIARKYVKSTAAWFKWLAMAGDSKKLLQIDRLIHTEDAMIFNRYYLDPERFPVIASMPLRDLHGANFAGLIQATYKLPITHVARAAQCAQLPEAACRATGVSTGSYGLVVEIAARAGRARPVFYQQLFVPANAGKLFISDSFTRWIASGESPAAERSPKAEVKRKHNRIAIGVMPG